MDNGKQGNGGFVLGFAVGAIVGGGWPSSWRKKTRATCSLEKRARRVISQPMRPRTCAAKSTT